MTQQIQNHLAAIRTSRGLAAADLARRVGVSRQTIYAIEAGTYVPNTEVTLKLARELEVSVEALFSLPNDDASVSTTLKTRILSSRSTAPSQSAARLCQIGDQWVSVPVSASPCYLPQADGVIASLNRTGHQAGVVPFAPPGQAFEKRLILAGCDPATSLLAAMVERVTGVEVVTASASSKLALSWLAEGVTHIAGSHLEDPTTGEFNLPYLRRQFPREDFAVITFAQWEEGFAVAPGNPKRIKTVEHLAHRNVRFINREPGSAARELTDRLLKQSGLAPSRVRGYQVEATGHLAAAYAVFAGEADCCLVTRSAAQAFGLTFVPLKTERYDLVTRRQTLQLPALQSLLDVLQRASLRRQLETLAGYDTRQTGATLA